MPALCFPRIPLILFFIPITTYAQLTLSEAKTAALEHNVSSYTYHVKFEGHHGYAAPIILTIDGGTAFFGISENDETMNVTKLDKNGDLEWQAPVITKFNEMETQSIVQDQEGNYYAFALSYNYSKYRGAAERVIYLDRDGSFLWDKLLGDYALINNPQCSYIHLNEDGRLELRGQIVTEQAKEGNDPEYRFWTSWLNNKGELTEEIGDIIDWSDPSWEIFFEIK